MTREGEALQNSPSWDILAWMRRKGQYRREHLPSTTRAVAWAAMFFAVLALIISVVNLLLTWPKLMQNTKVLVKEIEDRWESRPRDQDPAHSRLRDSLDGRLERIEKLIQSGDRRALPSLDVLKEDLQALRDKTAEKSSKWLSQAIDTVGAARDQLTEHGPAAAAKIRELANELKGDEADPAAAGEPGDGATPSQSASAEGSAP